MNFTKMAIWLPKLRLGFKYANKFTLIKKHQQIFFHKCSNTESVQNTYDSYISSPIQSHQKLTGYLVLQNIVIFVSITCQELLESTWFKNFQL